MKRVLCGLLLLSVPIQAIMLTTENLETVLEHCNRDTLVVFDVDDTLIAGNAAVKPRLMEENIPGLLRQIAQKGASMVALTARTTAYLPHTIEQLEGAGIRFADHCPIKTELYVREKKRDVLFCYQSGVICCGQSDKAAVLDAFIHWFELLAHYGISNIVFVDNYLEHVTSVEKMFGPRSIGVTSILYTKDLKNQSTPEAYAAYCEMVKNRILALRKENQ